MRAGPFAGIVSSATQPKQLNHERRLPDITLIHCACISIATDRVPGQFATAEQRPPTHSADRETVSNAGVVKMTTRSRTARTGIAASAGRGFADAANRAWQFLKRRHEQRKAAAYLSNMGDHELKDIGVQRWQIEQTVRGEHRTVNHSRNYWL
ncbi:MAG: DUF1127 domain-containing protein [Aestuariivirgaceae bacterium]